MSIDNISFMSSEDKKAQLDTSNEKDLEIEEKPAKKQEDEMICKDEENITPWRMYLRKTDSKLSLIG